MQKLAIPVSVSARTHLKFPAINDPRKSSANSANCRQNSDQLQPKIIMRLTLRSPGFWPYGVVQNSLSLAASVTDDRACWGMQHQPADQT